MHVHFEYPSSACSDCKILSLSWMGKVPDEVPEDDGWRLNRQNYYQEGWLATGNVHGIVGVTYTSCSKNDHVVVPSRTNYNLRGHRSEIFLVQWNEPYQKLATCDRSGIIFVWIKYEGRWSIELINDRNTPVTDFSWSHDGRMALICYQDGFVLVGSVAGQRYWSSMLNLNQSVVTCGIWSPDDQQVYFATDGGEIIVMDVHGSLISQVTLNNGDGIKTMSWNSPRFNMEETDDKEGIQNKGHSKEKSYVLLVMFQSEVIMLMTCIDDVTPIVLETNLKSILVQWSNGGHLLGIVGNDSSSSQLHFYTPQGVLLFKSTLSSQSPVSAFSWGHNDKRVFIASGKSLLVGWIYCTITTLQNLCKFKLYMLLSDKKCLSFLPLPPKLQLSLQELYHETVTCYIPDINKMHEFVTRPPKNNIRLHCTMIRHEDNLALKGHNGYHYVLYLEYLGGLIPLLKGKRTSKLRPEFVIFNPKNGECGAESILMESNNTQVCNFCGAGAYLNSDSDEEISPENSDVPPGIHLNSMEGSRLHQKRNSDTKKLENLTLSSGMDQLVLVTSNIWGTKFKIMGISPYLPSNLGQIIYKTSLLHLQPRQMTLCITDLSQDAITAATSSDMSHSSLLWSSFPLQYHNKFFLEDDGESYNPKVQGVPIAPMTPKSHNTSAKGYDLTQSFLSFNSRVSKECISSCLRKRATFESSFLSESEKDKKNGDDSVKIDEPLASEKKSVQIEIHSNILSSKQCKDDLLNTISGDFPTVSKICCESPVSLKTSSKNDKLKFIDEDTEDVYCNNYSSDNSPSHHSILNLQTSCKLRSHSVGQLNLVDTLHFGNTNTAELASVIVNRKKVSELPRRFVLSDKSTLLHSGKSRSLDSSPGNQSSEMRGKEKTDEISKSSLHYNNKGCTSPFEGTWELNKEELCSEKSLSKSPDKSSYGLDHTEEITQTSFTSKPNYVFHKSSHSGLLVVNLLEESSISESDISETRSPDWKLIPDKNIFKLGITVKKQMQCESRATRSIPSTPTMLKRKLRRSLPQTSIGKSVLNSPILTRRLKWLKAFAGDSSDDDLEEDYKLDSDYDTNMKSHSRLKLRKGSNKVCSAESSPAHSHQDIKQFILHNKAPLWNENSQVYQLDFGGRVTQESAKNFQIEFCGIQVMQFGRIDNNAYTLDFQYPFSAIQAFAVALANVTQRLK